MSIFHLPDLGEGLAEAEIHEWHVKVGDVVKVDQPLVVMETAKAVVDVPSPYSGKIKKLCGEKGEIIPTGAPLVEFESEEELIRKDQGTVVGNLEESSQILDEKEVIIGSNKKISAVIKAMPAVRALAKQLSVDLNLVKATGLQSQITAEDVKRSASQQKALFEKTHTLHGVKRAMAAIMTKSHQEIVPVTLMDDADITDLTGNDVTVSLLRAIVAAVKVEPALNVWFDGESMALLQHDEIHIGMAMDTEEGLFVPVIKNVGNKNSQELRAAIDLFKKSVGDRSVLPSELQGATITLSNFGMFAGRYASPIIVPPQAAILGCGRIRDEASIHDGKVAIRKKMPLSLTFDHRAVTGGEASRFLGAIIHFLEKN